MDRLHHSRRARASILARLGRAATPIVAAASLLAGACGRAEAPTRSAAPPARPAPPADARPMQLSREFWPNGRLKYEYEMRPSTIDGKWRRNGHSRAFYENGILEREGPYFDDERVGRWKFYEPDGSLKNESDYGPPKSG